MLLLLISVVVAVSASVPKLVTVQEVQTEQRKRIGYIPKQLVCMHVFPSFGLQASCKFFLGPPTSVHWLRVVAVPSACSSRNSA